MKKLSFRKPMALALAGGVFALSFGVVRAITWPGTPAGEIPGGTIGNILHPDSTSQKLGIGTYDPQGRLHIVGISGIKELTADSANGNGTDCAIGQEKVSVDTTDLVVGYLLGGEEIVTVSSGGGFVCLESNAMAWTLGDIKEWKDSTTDVLINTQGKLGIGTINPQEALDVAGAVRLGNTTTNTTGSVRFNESVSDFQGYTGVEWKSLTEGSGGSCVGDTGDDGSGGFVSDIATASCSLGNISYSTVEWESDPGIYKNYFGIEGNAANTQASVDCLGQGCKLRIICCTGGAGGTTDLGLVCAENQTIKWNSTSWVCANDEGGVWTTNATDIYYNAGKVGIGTMIPNALLHLKTTTGNNAEMNLQSGSQPHWAIYHDELTQDLRFWNTDNRVAITSGGNVGIGTIIPTQKLDVAGNVQAIEYYGSGTNLTGVLHTETDPTVNALGKSTYLGSCGTGSYPKWSGGAWSCSSWIWDTITWKIDRLSINANDCSGVCSSASGNGVSCSHNGVARVNFGGIGWTICECSCSHTERYDY